MRNPFRAFQSRAIPKGCKSSPMRRKPPAMSISVEPEMEEASFRATGIVQRVAITAASLFSEPPPLSRLCLSRYDLHPRWSKLRHHDVRHHERRWAGPSLHALRAPETG